MIQNRLTQQLNTNSKNILNMYCTAGYPKLNDTVSIIESFEKAGADIVEVGMPFSDPLADGPTIQMSNGVALSNGINIPKILEQLANIRQTVKIPIILMGYLNPLLQYGLEAFCQQCNSIGIDGLIIPDLPLDIYVSNYKTTFEVNNISNICLVTPRTSPERIKEIDVHCSGFIYAVTSNSTTGNQSAKVGIDTNFLKSLKQMNLNNPVIAGFNVKDKNSFDNACRFTNGAIIASAFIRFLKGKNNLDEAIYEFVKGIKAYSN